MLESIALILIILWVLGLVSSYTLGGFIHILLVIAVIVIIPLRQNSCRLKFLKKIKFEIRDENVYKVF